MSREVKVASLPPCDFCPEHNKLPAAYDGKTVMGPWAYMCEKHWLHNGVGQLGTGYGQRLVVEG